MATEHEDTMNEIALLNLRLSALEATFIDESKKTRDAMPEAIREIVTDDQTMTMFWGSAFDSLQSAAQRHTSRILFDGLKAILSRIMLFVTLGLIVYSIGGWTAIVKLWSVLWHQE